MSAESTAILLRALGLTSAARLESELCRRAEAENWGYERFLQRLLEEESNERLRRRMERLRKQSGLPAGKMLGVLDDLPEPIPHRRRSPQVVVLLQLLLTEVDFVGLRRAHLYRTEIEIG